MRRFLIDEILCYYKASFEKTIFDHTLLQFFPSYLQMYMSFYY